MKILNYVEGIWFDIEEEGIIAGPTAIIAEDANHPGYFEVFDTEEACAKFCEETNAEEGTAYFRLIYNEWLWNKANEALNNPQEDEANKEHTESIEEENEEDDELSAAVDAMVEEIEKYTVDGKRFNTSCIEAQMDMSIWEYAGCNTGWW